MTKKKSLVQHYKAFISSEVQYCRTLKGKGKEGQNFISSGKNLLTIQNYLRVPIPADFFVHQFASVFG